MNRALRWAAGAISTVSLAVLGWRSFEPRRDEPSRVTEVTLWTAGATTSAARTGVHVALPEATGAPREAERIPDATFLRRAFPALQRVTIEGEGLDVSQTHALSGLDVAWRGRGDARRGSPALVDVSAPRTLALGQRMNVQGRVTGLPPGEMITLSLEAPDGSKKFGDAHATSAGHAAFSIQSESAANAQGAFEWKLRLGSMAEPLVLGAVVAQPDLPRTLILQSAPTVEGGRLQRWLAEAGAAVVSRTRVSADHVRFSAAGDAVAEFGGINAKLLAHYDVVVALNSTLGDLSDAERAAIEAAIREHGIGLLVIGESDASDTGKSFVPWEIRRIDDREDGDENRVTRIRLREGKEFDQPVSVPAAEIVAPPPGRWLLRDPQGRILGAAKLLGRGWVARSLVTDTWRWLQHGHTDSYASYWSAMLSAVARPLMGSGHWRVDSGSGPLFTSEPVRLSWRAPASSLLPDADVRAVADLNDAPVPLRLVRNAREAETASAIYWPSRPGWHEVRSLPDGETMAFYVQSAVALPEYRAERRRDATTRLVGSNAGKNVAGFTDDAGRSFSSVDYAWFALLVASISALWWEQRRWNAPGPNK